jgi:hypothetical protein
MCEMLLLPDADNRKGKFYTVNDAVEHIGLGWFQMRLILICGLLQVQYYTHSNSSLELRWHVVYVEWKLSLYR